MPPPSAANLVYKTFVSRPSGQTVRIRLDEYSPSSRTSGPAPAVVLAHGGGWYRGCKSPLNEEAVAFADAGFIVFAIGPAIGSPDRLPVTPCERRAVRDRGLQPPRSGVSVHYACNADPPPPSGQTVFEQTVAFVLR